MPINHRQTYTSDGGGRSQSTYTPAPGYNQQTYGTYGVPWSAYGNNWSASNANSAGSGTRPNLPTGLGFNSGVTDNKVTTGRNNTTTNNTNTYNTYGSGSSGGGSSGGGSSGGGGGESSTIDWRQKYLDALEKAYSQYNKSQGDLLKQALANVDHDALEGRERNNLNTKLAERRVKNIYGGTNSGAKDSSMSRVWANWLNSGSDIERQRLNNRQTHQINYDQAIANNDLNYANALYGLHTTEYGIDAQRKLNEYLARLG